MAALGDIDKLLEQWGETQPDSLAIVDSNQALHYAALAEAVVDRSSRIRTNLPAARSIIGIYADRDIDTIINLFAILHAGGVPLMLDRLHPLAYRQTALRNSGASAVLAGTADIQALNGRIRTTLSDDDGYVSLTSGTSGKTKLVITPWASIRHYLGWGPERFGDLQLQTFGLLSGLGHDPLWRDVLTPLTSGATLHIPSRKQWSDGQSLTTYIENHAIQAFSCTPTQLSMMTRSYPGTPVDSVKRILIGGEQMRGETQRSARLWAPNAHLFNVYGLTETPQIAAYNDVTVSEHGGSQVLPIGQAAPGFSLSKSTRNTLVVESPYIARSFIDDDGFQHPIPNPLDTGDRVVADESEYRIIGRYDKLVKVRGAKVDLTFVEENIRAITGATSVQAYVDSEALHATVALSAEAAKLTPNQLRRQLGMKVPMSSIPTHIHFKDTSPHQTPNGKKA